MEEVKQSNVIDMTV